MSEVVLGPVYVRVVRADLVENRVTITLKAKLNDEVERAARKRLAWWSAWAVALRIELAEYQPELPGMDGETDGAD